MLDKPFPSAMDGPDLQDDRWRETHLGRLLGHAMRRFDARVLQLMAGNEGVPLALANLASRDQISAAHVHITRHLALGGSRLSDLARAAGMSKQAMGDLVDQCAAWGLVRREADVRDARARLVVFTPVGLAWLQAFQHAVAQAEAEFRDAVGVDVATVVALGLEAYAHGYGGSAPARKTPLLSRTPVSRSPVSRTPVSRTPEENTG